MYYIRKETGERTQSISCSTRLHQFKLFMDLVLKIQIQGTNIQTGLDGKNVQALPQNLILL